MGYPHPPTISRDCTWNRNPTKPPRASAAQDVLKQLREAPTYFEALPLRFVLLMLYLQDPARTCGLRLVGEARVWRVLLASLQGTRLKESADSGRSSPRQTETHTTPAKSKQHARKHIPNRHTKSTSTSGKEKGFALPGALNSYPRFLTGARYAYRSQMLLQSHIFHKEEPGKLTNEA